MRRTSFHAQHLAAISLCFLLAVVTAGSAYGLDHSGNITSDETWTAVNNPHVVTGNIHVYDNATLTIEPGTVVRFNPGTALYIGYYSAGALNATGTAGSPITFTSNASTPAPGDWQGIVFFNSTVDASTVLDHCTVEYGGNSSFNSNINCDNASPTIQNSTIRYSDEYGIYANNDSAPTLTDNTISDNGSFAISVFCNSLDSNVTGNMGSGNGTDAIEVRGVNMTSSHTWVQQGLYFNVTGNIHVYSDATLTIQPGSVVKFDQGTGLHIGYYSAAALIAAGSANSPIIFTSNAATPAPGDWRGIVFFNSTVDASTVLNHCTVEYGGYDSQNSNIDCNRASPTIVNCIIRHSDGYGIHVVDGSPAISCSEITGNTHGLYVSSGDPTVVQNSVAGNSSYGVYNDDTSVTLVAANNWWGDASGPSGIGLGTGDAVGSFIDFTPWLAAFDSCLGSVVLSPAFAENFIGSEHTVTAEVNDESGNPVQGVVVFLVITSGPHAGGTGTGTTDAQGEAAFTYTGIAEGTDTIEASFVDFHGRTIRSDAVTKTWVPANNPPVARCRSVTVSAGGDCRGYASVDDGSFDPDSGDTISLTQSPGGPYPLGTTPVTLTVTDNRGASSSCQGAVTVVDTVGPAITLKPSITLWAPDHKYREVTVREMVEGVSDDCNSLSIGDVFIESVTSDEPQDVPGDGDGNTRNDIMLDDNCKSVQLRAERDGTKNGRVYVATLRVMDASGNPARAAFKVTVPLNQSGSLAVQDAAAYTVTSSCP